MANSGKKQNLDKSSPTRDRCDLESQLYYAIDANDTTKLLDLLNDGLDPDFVYNGLDCLGRPLFWPALHLCCEKGREECVRMLLQYGADVDAADKRNQTALMYTVQTEWHNLVTMLIEAGADLDLKEKQGRTALHYAMDNSDEVCLRMLLEAGAALDIGDMYGRTPLWRAVSEDGRVDKVKVILDAGANPNQYDVQGRWTALQAAIKYADKDRLAYVKMLLGAGASVNHRDRDNHNSILNLIMRASRMAKPDPHGDMIQLAELFLQHGYDINDIPIRVKWHTYGGTVLKFACDKSAPYDVVKLLLEHGADPDLPDHTRGTALLASTLHGREDLSRLLIEHNCQLNIAGDVHIERVKYTFTPLQCAIFLGYLVIARMLVCAGAMLNDLTYLFTNQDVPEHLVLNCDIWCWLLEQATTPPPLVLICQRNVRKILGRNIHSKIYQLPLPGKVKDFLLLKDCT